MEKDKVELGMDAGVSSTGGGPSAATLPAFPQYGIVYLQFLLPYNCLPT